MNLRELLAEQTRLLSAAVSKELAESTRKGEMCENLRRKRLKAERVAARKGRKVDEDTIACLWRCVSYEHAIVWAAAESVPELRPVAPIVAAGRSLPPETVLRALHLWESLLRSNLSHRGIDPRRVVMFRETERRPSRPVMPAVDSQAEPESEWVGTVGAAMRLAVDDAMRAGVGRDRKPTNIHKLMLDAMDGPTRSGRGSSTSRRT